MQTLSRRSFASLAWITGMASIACHSTPAPMVHEYEAQSPASIEAYFGSRPESVLTFLGFSGSGYQDLEQLRSAAIDVLAQHDPETTLVNIGVTSDGIGLVYTWAQELGFETTGVVSGRALDGATISPYVDHPFFVEDESWGGYLPGSQSLSPTSRTVVAISDELVAIGGGEVARDELSEARKLGKPTRFIPADMNHELALEKAARKGQPAPTDMRGAAHQVFGPPE